MASTAPTLQDELLYVIAKTEAEIADLKGRGLPADDLEHRLDAHYARLRGSIGPKTVLR